MPKYLSKYHIFVLIPNVLVLHLSGDARRDRPCILYCQEPYRQTNSGHLHIQRHSIRGWTLLQQNTGIVTNSITSLADNSDEFVHSHKVQIVLKA